MSFGLLGGARLEPMHPDLYDDLYDAFNNYNPSVEGLSFEELLLIKQDVDNNSEDLSIKKFAEQLKEIDRKALA